MSQMGLFVDAGHNLSGVQQGMKQVQQEAKRTAAAVNSAGKSMRVSGRSFHSLESQTRSANFAMLSMTRVVQDAPFGFMAIQNNIDQAASSMAMLVQKTGGVRAAFATLGTALAGPAGLVAILSLAGAVWLKFGDDITASLTGLNKAEQAAKDAKKAFAELAKVESMFGFSADPAKMEFSLAGAQQAAHSTEQNIESIKAQAEALELRKKGLLGIAGGAFETDDIRSLTKDQRSAELVVIEHQLQSLGKRIGQEEVIRDTLQEQVAAMEAQLVVARRLEELGGEQKRKKGRKGRSGAFAPTDMMLALEESADAVLDGMLFNTGRMDSVVQSMIARGVPGGVLQTSAISAPDKLALSAMELSDLRDTMRNLGYSTENAAEKMQAVFTPAMMDAARSMSTLVQQMLGLQSGKATIGDVGKSFLGGLIDTGFQIAAMAAMSQIPGVGPFLAAGTGAALSGKNGVGGLKNGLRVGNTSVPTVRMNVQLQGSGTDLWGVINETVRVNPGLPSELGIA